MMKKHDFWIIGGAILLAGICAALTVFWQTPAGYAHIYLDNELYETVPLGKASIVEIKQENGSINRVEISREGVRMAHSSCPHQTCVEQGWLTPENSGTVVASNWIVCLPNRVSVEVVWEE